MENLLARIHGDMVRSIKGGICDNSDKKGKRFFLLLILIL